MRPDAGATSFHEIFPLAFREETSTAFLLLAFGSSTVGKSERLGCGTQSKV